MAAGFLWPIYECDSGESDLNFGVGHVLMRDSPVPISPANVRRHFLPWDRLLLPQAAAWLAKEWDERGPLDLARWLVVVPTRHAGRRLREALAEYASERGHAVFPPQVVTPETLVSRATARGTATRLEGLLAWAEILRGLMPGEFPAVLPREPAARDFAWAMRLGRELARLQATLAEAGFALADVSARAGADCPERERWAQLGELEERHAALLAARGIRDAASARIAAARSPAALAGVERIVVLATPDPLPLSLSALAVHASVTPVEVVVYAPEAEADFFDGWGRPRAEAWARREFSMPDFALRVRLCADPAGQAEWITAQARVYAEPGAGLGIGVADPELLPLLENALGRAGIAAFNPEGRSRRHDSLYPLLAALAALVAEPAFEQVAALLRCPDVLAWLEARAGGEAYFSPAELLTQLDTLAARHLPPTLAAAQARAADYPAVGPVLAEVAALRAGLVAGKFPENAAAALGEIFSARSVDAAGPLAQAAEVWMAKLSELGRALAAGGGAPLTLTEAWELALAEFADEVSSAERPAKAVDLLGWLEVLWDDAPHLIVAGCNEGRVPSAIVGDAFLPETLRVRLGLKGNAERLACDAYFLTAISESRRGANGRLEVVFGKTSSSGDPLRPSRLLLACPDEELPVRISQLFQPVAAARPGPPWARAWRLRPRRVEPLRRLSVTGLRDWLACPFRFYLKHGLRLARVEPEKAEMDGGDFGTLLHEALQRLGENAALRDCADAGTLRDFLLESFEAAARRRFGTELTLPLVVQLESGRQRLRAAAEVEARERREGWRTERVERKFDFALGALTIGGKIDRIDRHIDGRIRVLDYKTGDRPAEPETTHLRTARADDTDRPQWMKLAGDGDKPRVWADLQLPLYRRAVAAEFGDAVACGYFNLPKAVGETAVAMWPDFSRELQGAAELCATGLAAAVTAGEFWPPQELAGRAAEWDEFAELFHRGAAPSVEWGEPAR